MITEQDILELKKRVAAGYNNRDDYPPFSIDPFSDRFRFEEYIYEVALDMAEEQKNESETN